MMLKKISWFFFVIVIVDVDAASVAVVFMNKTVGIYVYRRHLSMLS